MKEKNYSKQILDLLSGNYSIDVRENLSIPLGFIPRTSKVISSYLGISEAMIRVYLTRLKNSGKIHISHKEGKWNYYVISSEYYYYSEYKRMEIINNNLLLENNVLKDKLKKKLEI